MSQVKKLSKEMLGEVKALLDEKAEQYNKLFFIETDPISVPHRYHTKEDIEIAGFFAATIAWGNRKIIIKNANALMEKMGESPYDFVLHAKPKLLKQLEFTHRTFNSYDLQIFVKGLRHIYTQHGGLQLLFERYAEKDNVQMAIAQFKSHFFEIPHLPRTEKHISDPMQGSAAKRINMMLRWFVRKDKCGVDLGIWNGTLKPSQLSCPLDVHSGNVARKLGLLTRTQNDAKAVIALDKALRSFDPKDPVKYDFALFGLGVFEGF